MNKHLVFMHQNYPAQFGPVIPFLLKHYDVDISFFSEYVTRPVYPKVNHHFFRQDTINKPEKPYFFTRFFEQEARSMHGVYTAMQHARKRGKLADPDLLISHPAFGNMGLMHVEFPEVPKIGFFELFYDPYEKVSDKRPEFPANKENRLRVPLRNATQLVELEYCTKGYSPTPFQKSTYPTAYQNKLDVLFDGINVDLYKPGEVAANSELKRTWPKDAKIITYVSRGLEAMRGFDLFMEAAHKICQERDDVHFVVAGNPRTHYGGELGVIKEASFKEHVLNKHNFDLNRFHFLDWISEPALVDLYRLSDCHFYWTVPFTLSWSFFQAMATGVTMVGSNTAPVRDVLQHNVNGLMVEPRDIDMMVETMLDVISNPSKHKHLGEVARDQMVENFSFDVCLPKLADFYMSTLNQSPVTPATKDLVSVS